MNREVSHMVDQDVYDKFCMALKLSNEEENAVIEKGMRSYIARIFDRVSHEYNTSGVNKTSMRFILAQLKNYAATKNARSYMCLLSETIMRK